MEMVYLIISYSYSHCTQFIGCGFIFSQGAQRGSVFAEPIRNFKNLFHQKC